MESPQHPEHPDRPDHEEPEHGPEVHISINGHDYRIHRGSRTVAEIKALGGVPAADDLDQIVNGQLTPLADDGRVTIKGGEKFVSHPKDSGASHG
jgi:hypothetical protein